MNSSKYHFADFTHEHYEELLLEAKKKYKFILFDEAISCTDPSVLWRHDVDFSMSDALDLAKIEHTHGVKSTYYLLLHGDFYSLLEHDSTIIAKKILNLGHDVGIHFDFDYHLKNSLVDFEVNLKNECLFLENILGIKVKSFSFHNPNELALSYTELSYAGLINAYAKEIKDKFYYCSDSNGYWRFERMYDVIQKNHNFLQALTHPMWWTKEVDSPKNKILNCIERRKDLIRSNYENAIAAGSRQIIDWE